jgi:hypothetical protein
MQFTNVSDDIYIDNSHLIRKEKKAIIEIKIRNVREINIRKEIEITKLRKEIEIKNRVDSKTEISKKEIANGRSLIN